MKSTASVEIPKGRIGHLQTGLRTPPLYFDHISSRSANEAWLSELKRSTEIVAYCRGPYCVLSYEAVAALRKRGYKVRRLEDGLPEWRAAGLPVVMGTS